MPPASTRIVVIGSSAGGIDALQQIVGGLPVHFPAPVLVAQHIGANPSVLPELLTYRGPNPAKFGETGEVPIPGVVYVAPPDHHMLIERQRIRLWKGPKEQHARPAINPLFRSAALEYGARTIGVILTGRLDDGAAGINAVKSCGGVTVVQDPNSADEPSMPLAALMYTAIDHVVPLEEMSALLSGLVAAPEEGSTMETPQELRDEHAASFGTDMRRLAAIGAPSVFTCPDCGGTLFELHDKRPVRFVCHTGHAYSLSALASMKNETMEAVLWSSLRAMQEKEAVLRRLAEAQAARSPGSEAQSLREAEDLAKASDLMRRLVEGG